MALKNQVVWVTGASSGIGRALALRLNESGNRVILSARNTTALQKVAQRCKYPENCAVLPLDLAEPAAFENKVQEAIAKFGSVDILVNNAGISQRSFIRDTEKKVYKRLMDINYLGTVNLTLSLLPYFSQRKRGHFVTVTSLMGRFGSPMRSGYCASKHALHGFFDVLRMEHEKEGIEVTLICPGFVQTDIAKNALTADGSKQEKQDKATAGGMTPEKFARKMEAAIAKKRWEVAIGGRETMGMLLKRFFPRLLHRVVMRSEVV